MDLSEETTSYKKEQEHYAKANGGVVKTRFSKKFSDIHEIYQEGQKKIEKPGGNDIFNDQIFYRYLEMDTLRKKRFNGADGYYDIEKINLDNEAAKDFNSYHIEMEKIIEEHLNDLAIVDNWEQKRQAILHDARAHFELKDKIIKMERELEDLKDFKEKVVKEKENFGEEKKYLIAARKMKKNELEKSLINIFMPMRFHKSLVEFDPKMLPMQILQEVEEKMKEGDQEIASNTVPQGTDPEKNIKEKKDSNFERFHPIVVQRKVIEDLNRRILNLAEDNIQQLKEKLKTEDEVEQSKLTMKIKDLEIENLLIESKDITRLKVTKAIQFALLNNDTHSAQTKENNLKKQREELKRTTHNRILKFKGKEKKMKQMTEDLREENMRLKAEWAKINKDVEEMKRLNDMNREEKGDTNKLKGSF